jgi:dTDP-4-amino-4,6-dideoxygalactose transaminase
MAWRIPMVDLEADYAEAGAAVEAAVLASLRSGRHVLGPETADFEAKLAGLVGVPFAVGVGSGTEALTLALRAVGVAPGDEVVVPAFTYFATVEAVLLCGARPVFVDVEPGGFLLDPAGLQEAMGPRTRAVVPVHLFGRCADVARIGELAERRGVAVVEDGAQAIGAARGGRSAGAWGRAGCFSFYPSKNLGAVGDAGAVTTGDAATAERLRLLRSHGLDHDGLHVLAGTTSRLDALQAAVLLAKLPFLESWTAGRARNAALYQEELSGCADVTLPGAGPDEAVVWSQYTILCRNPGPVRAALERAGIEWRHYYPRPACAEPALGELRRPPGAFPHATHACAHALSLPVRASCAPEAIREIAGVIREAARG